MSNYRDLEVWQLSRGLTKRIYQLTKTFPGDEMFGLTAQLRRAAVSIVCNIAEGQGRWTAKDQCRFYYVARGSLLELETQLIIAADLEYVDTDTVEAEIKRTEKIGVKINNLIRSTLARASSPRTRGPEDPRTRGPYNPNPA